MLRAGLVEILGELRGREVGEHIGLGGPVVGWGVRAIRPSAMACASSSAQLAASSALPHQKVARPAAGLARMAPLLTALVAPTGRERRQLGAQNNRS